MASINWDLVKIGLFQINPSIYQGRFPKPETFEYLKKNLIKNIINVSGKIYENTEFNILHEPFPDHQFIPLDSCRKCIDFFNISVQKKEKVFIHCMAGQNRSGAISYLSLISQGITKESAKVLVESATLDAVADSPSLLNDKHYDIANSFLKT